jgi:hypothetical protein
MVSLRRILQQIEPQQVKRYKTMKTHSLLKILLLATIVPLVATAQNRALVAPDVDVPGARAGQFEFTLGGNGVSNKDVDSTAGGGSASLGYYLTDTTEAIIRQSINYANPDDGNTVWNGSTRVGIDQHFSAPWAPVRPFIGATVGRIYGDTVEDTWASGLEVGAKFYVQAQTFIYTTVEYQWFFEDADTADNSFKQGQWVWSLGLGFNF